MRLSPKEIDVIIEKVKEYSPSEGTLYLYGSRSDDAKRGGDIDLLLIVKREECKEKIERNIPYLLVEIKEAIGDQSIDFSVVLKEKISESAFYSSVISKASILSYW